MNNTKVSASIMLYNLIINKGLDYILRHFSNKLYLFSISVIIRTAAQGWMAFQDIIVKEKITLFIIGLLDIEYWGVYGHKTRNH